MSITSRIFQSELSINRDFLGEVVTSKYIKDESLLGLMVDTARHFIPTSTILEILDGMEMDKLNVFHWHITDAEVIHQIFSSF